MLDHDTQGAAEATRRLHHCVQRVGFAAGGPITMWVNSTTRTPAGDNGLVMFIFVMNGLQ